MEAVLKKENDFWKISRRIVSLALPMAGSQFINVGSGFLCMAMLAQLGHEVLAASALIFAAQLSIMVSGMSLLFSLSVLVAHANGEKEYTKIGNFVQQGWTMGLLLSIPIMILFWYMGPILIYFGQSKEIANIVQSYFHAFIWAVIPGFLSTSNMQFGYGIHKKTLIVTTSFISVIVLLIAAEALIFGKWGMPKLGVAGLGYATAVQYGFYFILTTLFFYYDKSFKQYDLFRYRVHQHWNHFFQMFRIGWPISIQMGGEMLSIFVSGILVGWLGTTSLAAIQIVNQYYFLIVIPMFSLSQASGILVGHASGAKQFHEVKKLSNVSIAIVLAITLLVACLFFLFPKSLASFYLDVNDPLNAATLHLTIILFMIDAVTQVFDGLRNVLIGILRGLFDTRFPMNISLISIWIIGMPLGYILAFPLHFGAQGFLFGCMLGMLFGASVMMYRWHVIGKKY